MRGKIKDIEARTGRCFRDVLIEAMERHNGRQQQVAQELGVSQSTISIQLRLLGLHQRVVMEGNAQNG